jgi:hypothetical protein
VTEASTRQHAADHPTPETIATFKADDGCTVTITDHGPQDPAGRTKYVFTTDAGHLGVVWVAGSLPTSYLIDSAFAFLDEIDNGEPGEGDLVWVNADGVLVGRGR